MSPNYHSSNHNMDYRNGSFYDNHQQQQQQQQRPYHCTDDDELVMHRQHYFFTTTTNDRHSTIMTITTTAAAAAATTSTSSASTRATDSMHSSSDASSKSERQMPTNHYHQQNGYRMPSKNQPAANNNECESMASMDDSHVSMHQRNANVKQTISQYGKIINSNKLLQTSGVAGKDHHRNGTRPIPMLPSPPSTPPPPLNAKIKDYHDSSNKFYQDFQSTLHLSNHQQNRFNGNINSINNNNNNNNNHHTSEVNKNDRP